MRRTDFPLATLAASLLAALAVACASPPAGHARAWSPLAPESQTHSHSSIAAAIDPTPAPPAPAAPALASGGARKAKRGPRLSVRLYTSDGADCPTEALGVVNERSMGDDEAAVERLKDKARAMGADAIVGYRSESKGLGTDYAGMAVRCRELTKGRAYETLGELEVPAVAGDEDEAFDELLAKADRMHANLVLGVHVVPGVDGAPSKVVGAAIKYR